MTHNEPAGSVQVVASANTERRQRIIDDLKRRIVLGEAPLGARIIEADVTKRLGTSRPTVREALNQLARDGYLVQEAYRGYRVSEISAEQIREMATVRLVNDMVAIDAILADPTGGRMALLDEVLGIYLDEMRSPDSLGRHKAHMAFHRGIWEASGNSFLMKLWPVMEAEMTLVLAAMQHHRHDDRVLCEHHRSLVECIQRGDRAEIQAELHAHVLGSSEEILELTN